MYSEKGEPDPWKANTALPVGLIALAKRKCQHVIDKAIYALCGNTDGNLQKAVMKAGPNVLC